MSSVNRYRVRSARHQGFSLIELMLTLFIAAILMAVRGAFVPRHDQLEPRRDPIE